MSTKEGITREELARRIEDATKNVPPLGKPQWKTIYLALARERRRVKKLAETVAACLDTTDPDVREMCGRLEGKVEHIERIMDTLGEAGRNMLLNGVGRSIYLIDGKQGGAE
jgi:RNase adaptor protein for sRNA GlmZ degradation